MFDQTLRGVPVLVFWMCTEKRRERRGTANCSYVTSVSIEQVVIVELRRY